MRFWLWVDAHFVPLVFGVTVAGVSAALGALLIVVSAR